MRKLRTFYCRLVLCYKSSLQKPNCKKQLAVRKKNSVIEATVLLPFGKWTRNKLGNPALQTIYIKSNEWSTKLIYYQWCWSVFVALCLSCKTLLVIFSMQCYKYWDVKIENENVCLWSDATWTLFRFLLVNWAGLLFPELFMCFKAALNFRSGVQTFPRGVKRQQDSCQGVRHQL